MDLDCAKIASLRASTVRRRGLRRQLSSTTRDRNGRREEGWMFGVEGGGKRGALSSVGNFCGRKRPGV